MGFGKGPEERGVRLSIAQIDLMMLWSENFSLGPSKLEA